MHAQETMSQSDLTGHLVTSGDDSNNDPKNSSTPRHRRGYQACEPCRERKVKCDMGSVDNPHSPPCAKCRREHKECVFSTQRKKSPTRRTINVPQTAGMKRLRSDSIPDETTHPARLPPISASNGQNTFETSNFISNNNPFSSPMSSTTPLSAAAALRRPMPSHSPPNQTIPFQPMTQSLQQTRPMKVNGEDEEYQTSSTAQKLLSGNVASSQDGIQLLFKAAAETSGQSPNVITSPTSDSRGSRGYSSVVSGNAQEAAEAARALEAWSHMRFVRAGWFTAQEAMDYIEYFYTRLAPMTPVVTPDFRRPAKHITLLTEEPVLTLAILAIASRHMPLQGSGRFSRTYNVHDKLWDALRRMVERLLWGQEQFGGGFCGAGSYINTFREPKTGLITWKGSLRTLGTIEALLLLTDWQPRALHFPPGDEENWLLDPRFNQSSDATGNKEDNHDGFAYTPMLEPGWRSDRMSWMLLGLAQSLSFELGVFNDEHDTCGMRHGPDSDCARRRRLRRLVLLYVTQVSGRIGIKPMLSPSQDSDPIFDKDHIDDKTDVMQNCWMRLSLIMYTANKNIFLSTKRTRELMENGKYKNEIDKLMPMLHEWKSRFSEVSHMLNPTMRCVLSMEWEYARLFINSVGFNKVVDFWNKQGPSPQTATVVKIVEENKQYCNEVKDAATNVVVHALDGFAAQNQLRNAPVRTYLRSLAGIVYTLKLFTLGNHETYIRQLVSLLNRIIAAMEQQVVDDVHLSLQTAASVKIVVQNVMRNLIRVQKTNGTSGPPSRAQSRQQSPHRGTNAGLAQSIAQNLRYDAANTNDLSPDPFENLPSRPYADFTTQIFMPPPDFLNNNTEGDDTMQYDPNIDPSMADLGFANTDWFALPLDGIFASSNAPVESGWGGIGPALGDRDLLEVLTEAHSNNQGQWSSSVQAQNHGQGYGNMNGY